MVAHWSANEMPDRSSPAMVTLASRIWQKVSACRGGGIGDRAGWTETDDTFAFAGRKRTVLKKLIGSVDRNLSVIRTATIAGQMASASITFRQVTPAQRRTLVAAALGWALDAFDVMLYAMTH